ncbi:hypothetical protein BegalDRAFT_0879 [Beggiatoa alba B18LD]|uniref:CHAT domain-containing protein n=2 Tax=Beggiatoa alba TaxID=1022 RepID=I3CDU4_9GAMM|nr:hypothetical protein BegalDRAFT_0879 [Beggiatoa alba B18LD]
MDERLIEAVKAFLQVSSNEELGQVLQAFPELLTQETEINAIFEFGIAQARGINEIEKAEFFEQRHQMLKKIQQNFAQQNNNPFISFIQQAQTAEQQYLRTSDRNSLDRAIQAWEHILQHPEFEKMGADFKLRVLNDSAITYSRRYRARGQLADLNTALRAWEFAVANTPPDSPDLPSMFNNLGNGLSNRYSRSGELADLQVGIEAYQQATDKTPPDSPDLPSRLNNLGTGLRNRYSRSGELADLQAGIKAFQQAIEKTPPNSPELSGYLNNLGAGLTDRYSHSGELADLQAGIVAYQQAIEKTPPDSPDLPSRLNNLGTGLRDRYSRSGELADLQAGIAAFQQAIDKTPPDSPDLPSLLNNLGNGLRDRYSRSGELADLQAGIAAFQQAIEKTLPDSLVLPAMFNNLGIGLTNLYSHSGELADLQAGIEAYQQAIEKTPPDSPDLPSRLNNLGNGLRDRYSHSRELADLQAGIAAFQQAIEKTPPNSPKLSGYLNNLGAGLRYHYSRSGELADLQAGIAAFQQAVGLGEKHSIADWLTSARNWLNWAFERNSWTEIEEAYPALQKASKQLVEKQLLREHQEAFLQDTQGIAVKVAYARIQTGQLEKAVEALEQGVARLLSNALARSNADLTQLQQDSPELYERYQESLQAVNTTQRFYQNATDDLREKAQSDWQTAEKQFNELLENIRQLQGHENFLLIATDINTVKQVSQQQPLIYVFFTEKGGYALNVFQGQIQAIALPELTNTVLSEKVNSYFQAYNKRKENRDAWFNAIETMTTWLYQAVMQLILQNIPTDSQITLIPIGLLNLLPLHAAYATTDNKRRYVLDDYMISYAPNALSLQTARKRTQIPRQKLLAIENPTEDLIACTIEIEALEKYFEERKIFTHEEATQEAVKNALNNDYSVLHFSCHGGAELEDPLKTGLLMAHNEMLTVQDFLNAQLNARLVSLSACETGMIGVKQVEEVVSLPTSLLQAGVACIVSSLWSVDAYSTAFLMIKFYEYFKDKGNEPVIALSKAQQWLRMVTKVELLKLSKTFPTTMQGKIEQQLGECIYSNDKPYEAAYYWAAFYVTGE